MTWLQPLIPHFKAVHIIALCLWVGGLVALPVLLARHDRAVGQADYSRIRLTSHIGYVWITTPAAVVAIIAGTWLIFLRDAFSVWMFAKLVLVALLIGFHAWVGHHVEKIGETDGHHEPPDAGIPLAVVAFIAVLILAVVLTKPPLELIAMPDWLSQPLGRHLPVSEVPR